MLRDPTVNVLRDNGPAMPHKVGTRVIDYVAYKLATHLIAARPGTLTSFETLEDGYLTSVRQRAICRPGLRPRGYIALVHAAAVSA